MPLVNYARDALVCHCLDLTGWDVVAAGAQLDAVVRGNGDFLVQYAIIPPGEATLSITLANFISVRFNAARWVANFHKRYHEKSNLYAKLLARACLLTPGLEVPDELWQSGTFRYMFRQETRHVLTVQSRPPRFHNFDLLRAHPEAGEAFSAIENAVPREVQRYEGLYTLLVRYLDNELPPIYMVTRLLGRDYMQEYRAMLEELDAIDVTGALERGEQRQKRGHGLWSVEAIEKSLARINLLLDGRRRGFPQMVIGEMYEQMRDRETAARNARDTPAIETARELGAWRVRKADMSKWQNALDPDEWETYLRCETAMRTQMPSGVVSRIPRRHFNANSVSHMKHANLAALCTHLQLQLSRPSTLPQDTAVP